MSRARPGGRRLFALLCAGLLFSACLSDSAEPTIDLDSTPLPGTAIVAPTATATPLLTPTPSVPAWLPPLLESGPTALVSPALFFHEGPDAWLIDGDLEARQVTQQRRVRDVATRPGVEAAAVLLSDAAGGRETEEIRIVDAEGEASEPVYGPEIVSDPGGNPRVAQMRWSPDGARLAILREDDSLWLTGPEETAAELELPEAPERIEAMAWAPGGQALVILHRAADNAGMLRIVPIDGSGQFDVLPLVSFGAVCWPSGSGYLIASEDRGAGPNPNAGSLFRLAANGANRELLVSAGEFGPAVRIGALAPSPDGAQLAFTIEAPGPEGDFQFQSLYVQELGTGIRRRLEVASGFVVSDLWWFERGLLWRAIEAGSGGSYSGVEPFIIEFDNVEAGRTSLLYTSDGT